MFPTGGKSCDIIYCESPDSGYVDETLFMVVPPTGGMGVQIGNEQNIQEDNP